MRYAHLAKYFTAEKQRNFETNFFLDADKYEVWDEIEIGREYTSPRKFEVLKEDIVAFSQAIMDPNPLFNDEEYAKRGPWGGLIAHPLFYVAISFYCIELGPCNWVRTPGCFNPGQLNLFFEPFRPGDIISLKLRSTDRWIKRGKHYLQYQQEFFDQLGTIKVRRWPTLIVPPTRDELRRYVGLQPTLPA